MLIIRFALRCPSVSGWSAAAATSTHSAGIRLCWSGGFSWVCPRFDLMLVQTGIWAQPRTWQKAWEQRLALAGRSFLESRGIWGKGFKQLCWQHRQQGSDSSWGGLRERRHGAEIKARVKQAGRKEDHLGWNAAGLEAAAATCPGRCRVGTSLPCIPGRAFCLRPCSARGAGAFWGRELECEP